MPSEEQYLHMVINKTSVLPRLNTRFIAAIVADKYPHLDNPDFSAKMVAYVESLGAAF